MKIGPTIGLAWRSLHRNKLRSFLMMLGVTVGITALTALASVGEATKQETLRQFKRMVGTFDMLSVRPGATATRGMPSLSAVEPTITFMDAPVVAAVPGVKRVAEVQQAFDLEVVYGSEATVPAVFGVGRDWADIRGESVATGENITDDDLQKLARVVVIGEEVRATLFRNEDPLGKLIRIGDVPFQVKGVFGTRGAGPGGASLDNMVVVPVTTASRRLFNRDYLTSLLVQIEDEDQSEAVASNIRQALREQHRLAAGAADDFTVTSPRATIEQITSVGTTLGRIMNGVSLIATLIGGVVIMSLMLVAVSQRRREIGVRRALGATRADIMGQFVVEAALIAGIGGLLGIVLGAGGATLAAVLQKLPPALMWSSILVAAVSSVGVGLLAGLHPAWKAARVDPISALQG